MVMTPGVTDQVWEQLDPGGGRLARRTTRRLLLAAAITLVLVAGGGLVWRSGLFTTRLSWPFTSGMHASAEYRVIMHSVTVGNDGWIPLTLLGAGRDGPGLRLDRVDGKFPMTVEPGGEVTFDLTYTVTDCQAVPAGAWPVPVRVDRWWGEQTVHIELPTETASDAPSSFSYSGDNPYGVQWQRWLADTACSVQVP